MSKAESDNFQLTAAGDEDDKNVERGKRSESVERAESAERDSDDAASDANGATVTPSTSTTRVSTRSRRSTAGKTPDYSVLLGKKKQQHGSVSPRKKKENTPKASPPRPRGRPRSNPLRNLVAAPPPKAKKTINGSANKRVEIKLSTKPPIKTKATTLRNARGTAVFKELKQEVFSPASHELPWPKTPIGSCCFCGDPVKSGRHLDATSGAKCSICASAAFHFDCMGVDPETHRRMMIKPYCSQCQAKFVFAQREDSEFGALRRLVDDLKTQLVAQKDMISNLKKVKDVPTSTKTLIIRDPPQPNKRTDNFGYVGDMRIQPPNKRKSLDASYASNWSQQHPDYEQEEVEGGGDATGQEVAAVFGESNGDGGEAEPNESLDTTAQADTTGQMTIDQEPDDPEAVNESDRQMIIADQRVGAANLDGEVVDGDSVVECPLCEGFAYRDIEEYLQHFKLDHPEHRFQCPKCEYNGDKMGKVKRHYWCKHDRSKLPYMCDLCGGRFVSPSDLTKHRNIHMIGEHPLPWRPNKPTQEELEEQVADELEPGSYECPVCSKTFLTMDMYHKHYRSRHVLKRFQCMRCPSSFLSKGHLNRHTNQVHLKIRTTPHACTLCDGRFEVPSQLKTHMIKKHSNERPYKCELCDAQYVESHLFKRHMLLHKVRQPYQCRYCDDRFFSTSRKRDNHEIAEHTFQFRYHCDICRKGFCERKDVRYHKRKDHKDEEDIELEGEYQDGDE